MKRFFISINIINAIIIISAFIPANQNKEYKIEYPQYFGNKIYVSENNPTTKADVLLGRYLFYETVLSANNKISCASCHKQKYAFTDGQRFSTGVDGSAQMRNAMSLANLLWVRDFFWDGRASSLEEQAKGPLTNPHEMGQALAVSAKKLNQNSKYRQLFLDAFHTETITEDLITRALAQFERTLISANSKYDQYLKGEYNPTESELKGISLFYTNSTNGDRRKSANCSRCHGGPKTFENLFHNNGLDNQFIDQGRAQFTGQSYDLGRFRVVTLRNIELTGPYMHDGRFNTLEEVIDHYSEHVLESATLSPILRNGNDKQLTLNLTTEDKKNLLSFLKMLTDTAFTHNKNYSNPF